MVIISAHIKFKFKKGFLLNEEKLRKIQDIISQRIKENEIKYKVFRNDSFSFETKKLEDIIAQENLKGSEINEIRINLDKKNEALNLSLIFDGDGADLTINGDNRDTVFLLNSDLKEYINADVCTNKTQIIKKFDLIYYSMVILLIISFGFLVYPNVEHKPSGNEAVVKALESNDLNEKINILIQDKILNDEKDKRFPYFIGSIISVVVLISFSKQINDIIFYFYPNNVFLFGKEIEKYNQRLANRGKIFWGLIVATTISIIAGLIVTYMTPK